MRISMKKNNIKKTENLLILSLIIFLGACFCHIMEYKTLSEVMLGAALLPVPAFLFIEASKRKSSFLFIIGIAIILVISYGVFSSFI